MRPSASSSRTARLFLGTCPAPLRLGQCLRKWQVLQAVQGVVVEQIADRCLRRKHVLEMCHPGRRVARAGLWVRLRGGSCQLVNSCDSARMEAADSLSKAPARARNDDAGDEQAGAKRSDRSRSATAARC